MPSPAWLMGRWSRSPAWSIGDGAHPLPQRALPPDMSGLVAHCKAYEHLAVEAAMSGSRDTMIRALVANPLVGQYPLAEHLADALAGHQSCLPPAVLPR